MKSNSLFLIGLSPVALCIQLFLPTILCLQANCLEERDLMCSYGKRAVTGFETANVVGRLTNIVWHDYLKWTQSALLHLFIYLVIYLLSYEKVKKKKAKNSFFLVILFFFFLKFFFQPNSVTRWCISVTILFLYIRYYKHCLGES